MSEDLNDEEMDRANQFIELMIQIGAIEVCGYDEKTDSFTYNITSKMKDLIPEFFEEHMKHVNQISFDLWNRGYVEIYFNEDGPLVSLKKDIDYDSIMDKLSDEERYFIQNMLNHYKGGII